MTACTGNEDRPKMLQGSGRKLIGLKGNRPITFVRQKLSENLLRNQTQVYKTGILLSRPMLLNLWVVRNLSCTVVKIQNEKRIAQMRNA